MLVKRSQIRILTAPPQKVAEEPVIKSGGTGIPSTSSIEIRFWTGNGYINSETTSFMVPICMSNGKTAFLS